MGKSWITASAAWVLAAWSLSSSAATAGPVALTLPTDNDAIFSDDPSRFYMYTDRNFENEQTKPWSAGRFGFVRNQRRTDSGIIFTRFHEGIDIRPLHRDDNGVPLDEVRSISDGEVMYANGSSRGSNYGRYVVVRHDWGDGPFYSLYAHLRSVAVNPGDTVKAGQTLGGLGYSGAGINRERAHVHVELTMMLSERFQGWYGRHFRSADHHGNFNGFNLAGLDVAGLFHAHRDNPATTIPEFFATLNPYFTVAVPNRGRLEILERYPWLGRDLERAGSAPSWEISLTGYGLPVSITPGTRRVEIPEVVWVTPSKTNHSYHTLARITGTGSEAKLTSGGTRYIQLLAGDF